jgi:hypothetical protein
MGPAAVGRAAWGSPRKKPPQGGGFEMLAEWTSIELVFQEIPEHPDIACRSLIHIDFLAKLVHSDSRAFR